MSEQNDDRFDMDNLDALDVVEGVVVEGVVSTPTKMKMMVALAVLAKSKS